jgi:hypothetical protein
MRPPSVYAKRSCPAGDPCDLLAAASVNVSEAVSVGNHCVVVGSSFGWLIHAAVGSAGGVGGSRTKRSGWVA